MSLRLKLIWSSPVLVCFAWLCTCQGEESTTAPPGGTTTAQGGGVTGAGGGGGAAGSSTSSGTTTTSGGGAGGATGAAGSFAGGGGSSASSGSGGGGVAGGGVGGEGEGGEGGAPPNICQGHAGTIFCSSNVALTCNPMEQLLDVQVCGDKICVDGVGCQICQGGTFHCEGNEVMQCDPNPPAKWISKNPKLTCNAPGGQACDAKSGTCKALQIIGSNKPTGTYFQFATFSGNPFKTGYDVDCYGDTIYVNRSGQNLDIYTVALLDSDKDGKLEPNQHPNDPNNPGPIEQRVLTFVKTLTKSGDGVPLGPASAAELFADSDRIFSLGPGHDGTISEYVFNTKKTTVFADSLANHAMSQLAISAADGSIFGSNEGARRVYSFHKPSQAWVAEFAYPDLAGSHMDGLEVVSDPHNGRQYVYVSDMTSDFLGQYWHDPDKGWVQVNLFQYADKTGSYVEGMGFGTLNHFWATGGNYLYEIGGGDLTEFLEN
ncbi:MAG: hypothetical protein HY744_03420 [Deltaproteobacteria bacterium]|nr:hypothetical protein [Deltaproteobacteria bacterium]